MLCFGKQVCLFAAARAYEAMSDAVEHTFGYATLSTYLLKLASAMPKMSASLNIWQIKSSLMFFPYLDYLTSTSSYGVEQAAAILIYCRVYLRPHLKQCRESRGPQPLPKIRPCVRKSWVSLSTWRLTGPWVYKCMSFPLPRLRNRTNNKSKRTLRSAC